MSATIYSLLGFVAWTLVLLGLIAVARVSLVITGNKKPNEFRADEDHGGSERYKNLLRAHLNCCENLPIYGAVTLSAAVLGVTGLTDPLSYPFLACRVAQSVTHLIGTSPLLVNIRFTFFVVQYGIVIGMLYQLLA